MIMSNTVYREVVILLLLWWTLEDSRASNTAETINTNSTKLWARSRCLFIHMWDTIVAHCSNMKLWLESIRTGLVGSGN